MNAISLSISIICSSKDITYSFGLAFKIQSLQFTTIFRVLYGIYGHTSDFLVHIKIGVRQFATKNQKIFDPYPRPPQISNQIDAADVII